MKIMVVLLNNPVISPRHSMGDNGGFYAISPSTLAVDNSSKLDILTAVDCHPPPKEYNIFDVDVS